MWEKHSNQTFFVDKEIVEDIPRKNSLVVNFLGGPGSGKSSMCYGVTASLKWKGINAEMAAEFAKDLTWEERSKTFEDQLYIFGKQYHRIFRLLGQVDVVLTDSPILLTPLYDANNREYLKQLVLAENRNMWTYNVFIKRVKPFQQKGRIHNEKEARLIDRKVLDFLDDNDLCFEVFDGDESNVPLVTNKITLLLNHEAKSNL